MRNPHFDDGLVVWSDEYSGRYAPPVGGFGEQFDLQWKVALEGNQEYFDSPGCSTDLEHIKDRVYEWTGQHPDGGGFRDARGNLRKLDHSIDPALIKGKRCADVGCGMGRWTRTMQMLGAREVLSIDMSESGLASTRAFNPNVLRTDITRLREEHPELAGQFDFVNFWGVAMCTHDPLVAFLSAASLVKPGGHLFLMVYAPEGMHNTPLVIAQRRIFNSLRTVEDRLAFVDHVADRRWDWRYPLFENLKNVARDLFGRPKSSKICVLDMLEPYYNWVIPLDVIEGWMRAGGFTDVVVANEYEKPKCAFYVLARKKEA